MKRLTRAALFALTAAVILLFAGCSSEVETIRGTWHAKSGYTVVITDTTFEVFDAEGNSALAQGAVPYEWKQDAIAGDTLSLMLDGTLYPVFDSYLSEDTLKLTYTKQFQEMAGGKYSGAIRLYREK